MMWHNPSTAPPPGTRISFAECSIVLDLETQQFVEVSEESMHDEFDHLPDAVASRARHFKESDPTISRAEAVTRAFNDPAARRAYAESVERHNTAVSTGRARGPQETVPQYRESQRQFAERVGAPLDKKPATSGGTRNRDGGFTPNAGVTAYENSSLGKLLEPAIAKILAAHPEYSRGKAIAEAMKLKPIADAYAQDREQQSAGPTGGHY